jgi:hypothetical protein
MHRHCAAKVSSGREPPVSAPWTPGHYLAHRVRGKQRSDFERCWPRPPDGLVLVGPPFLRTWRRLRQPVTLAPASVLAVLWPLANRCLDRITELFFPLSSERAENHTSCGLRGMSKERALSAVEGLPLHRLCAIIPDFCRHALPGPPKPLTGAARLLSRRLTTPQETCIRPPSTVTRAPLATRSPPSVRRRSLVAAGAGKSQPGRVTTGTAARRASFPFLARRIRARRKVPPASVAISNQVYSLRDRRAVSIITVARDAHTELGNPATLE